MPLCLFCKASCSQRLCDPCIERVVGLLPVGDSDEKAVPSPSDPSNVDSERLLPDGSDSESDLGDDFDGDSDEMSDDDLPNADVVDLEKV